MCCSLLCFITTTHPDKNAGGNFQVHFTSLAVLEARVLMSKDLETLFSNSKFYLIFCLENLSFHCSMFMTGRKDATATPR